MAGQHADAIARERPAQIGSNQLDDGIAPVVRLLLFHDPAADVPVKQDGLMGNGPSR